MPSRTTAALVVAIPGVVGIAIWIAMAFQLDMATMRDALIILVAMESLILLGVLIVVGIASVRLAVTLRREVMPLVGSAQRTVSTVGAAVGLFALPGAQPLLRVAAAMVGIGQLIGTLFRLAKKKGGK